MKSAVTFAILLFAFGCIFDHLIGCTPPAAEPSPKPAFCFEPTAFEDLVVACGRTGKDWPAVRACQTSVHAACGITVTFSKGAARQ